MSSKEKVLKVELNEDTALYEVVSYVGEARNFVSEHTCSTGAYRNAHKVAKLIGAKVLSSASKQEKEQ